MTREELIEAIARAMAECEPRSLYGDAVAALAALEAAGVRLVPVEELEDLLAGPAAWLDRWAQHVGTCWGGDVCTCGLTLARTEACGVLIEPGQ